MSQDKLGKNFWVSSSIEFDSVRPLLVETLASFTEVEQKFILFSYCPDLRQ